MEREKPPGTPQTVHNQYIVNQAGAVGPNAHVHDMTFNQLQTGLNLTQLAAELSTLRTALKGRASEPEHDMAVGVIAEAEVAAKQGNGQKALAGLKKAGKWTWEVATDIGTTLVAEVIKKQMGL